MPAKRLIVSIFLTFICLLKLTPQDIAVEVSVGDSYIGNPIDSAMVSILKDGAVIDSAYTDIDGIAIIQIPATGVGEHTELPSTISLTHNYPNPFKDDTRVDIGIPEAQTIIATVYNILGQRVASEQIPLDAGYYQLNLSLGHLSTGVYFFRIDGIESRTIKLMKMGRGFHPAGPVFSVSAQRIPGGATIGKIAGDGFTLRVSKDRYETHESSVSLRDNPEFTVPLERLNKVGFSVTYNEVTDIPQQLIITGLTIDGFTTSVLTPDTIILKSGLYRVYGETDSTLVFKVIEISSLDTTMVFDGYLEEIQWLEPGGFIIGRGRVAVGAPPGALDEGVEVRIERVDDPTTDAPLPVYIQRDDLVGGFYRLTASREVITPARHYLALGLPVPDGITPQDLSIAILSPAGMVVQDDELEPKLLWTTVRGYFDATTGFFGTIIPYIGSEPQTFVLVEGVNYTEHETGYNGTSEESYGQTEDNDSTLFNIVCVGYESGECTDEHREQTLQVLHELYGTYVDKMGYPEPNLSHRLTGYSLSPPDIIIDARYEYRLEKSATHNGYYRPLTRQAATRFPGSPDTLEARLSRHEFFHALQFGFSEFHSNYINRFSVPGVIEGTAVAAESSPDSLTRSHIDSHTRGPLGVEVSLFNNESPDEAYIHDYRAQDFWVYVGKVINPDNPTLDFLIPLFEKGGLKAHIDEIVQDDTTFSSLGDAYWQWAKNQSFEKSVILGSDHRGDPVPGGDPCALYIGAADPEVIDFFPDSWRDHATDFTLGPLSSKVFQINFNPGNLAYATPTSVSSDSNDIRVKFYFEGEAGTNDCRDRSDNAAHVFAVDTMVTGYVLISNVRADEPMQVGLKFGEPTHVVIDVEGNSYPTVRIGSQVWMTENLRTTKYQNEDEIPGGLDNATWQNTTSGSYAVYPHGNIAGIDSEEEMLKAYGALYNWFAVNDPRGLCPAGWRIPDDDDWKELEMTLGMSQEEAESFGLRGTDEGGKLKSTRTQPDPQPRWDDPNTGATNVTGWSGLPAGSRGRSGAYSLIGSNSFLWSATEDDDRSAWYRYLSSINSNISKFGNLKQSGYSVRCVTD